GRIRHISVKANHNLDNIYGLTFELEFDTSIFKLASSLIHVEYPVDTLVVSYNQAMYHQGAFINSVDFHYGFVGTEHTNLPVSDSFGFINSPFGLKLKSGLTIEDIPDSTILCLKNLLGLDSDGNDLHLGSECLVVHKQVVTGNQDPDDDTISIYPNPTRNALYVETQDEVSGEIINLQGQSIQKVHIKKDSPIDVSDLGPGLYLLRISGSSHTYKIVIY
ncbi:MAG: T9SS type A sorting domain-containing protein, partial [Saprospiraceae bacterium]